MNEPAVRVRHLWQRIGTHDVLRDVSFDVGQGEVFGFIGPNGAGKTTTIRVMTTLTPPTSGRVEVCGHDVATEPRTVRRLIGYMPDYAGIYPNVTVREYLEFFADAHGMTQHGKDYRVVEAALELTGLSPLDGKTVATMSKGMKQRLQLARILLHDPKILILDEPASDLDPRARIEMRDLVVELARLGKTVFLSSHILTELADVCTSVAILERGQLMASGPVAQIASMLEAKARGGDPALALAAPPAVARGLKLRVLGPLDAVLEALRAMPNVVRVEGSAAAGVCTLVASYHGEERVVADWIAMLVGRGFGVLGVEPERNELERIFMQVTRGEMQ